MNRDPTNAAMQDFDGADVVDSNGDAIGSVERTYDDDDGTAHLVEVKIGTLFAKHRLIPLDGAKATNQGLQVPYDKQTIEGSPDAGSAGDTLEGAFLDGVMAYYAGSDDDSGAAGTTEDEPGAAPAEAAASTGASNADEPES